MRNLHNEIMNIPVGGKGVSIAREALTDSGGVHIAYKIGHRDARHAAAELAKKYDDNHERLVEALASAVDIIEMVDPRQPKLDSLEALIDALEAEKGGEL